MYAVTALLGGCICQHHTMYLCIDDAPAGKPALQAGFLAIA